MNLTLPEDPIEPTKRDRQIIQIARRETSREHTAEFEPFTHGPLFAIAGLCLIAPIAALFLAGKFIAKLTGGKSKP